MRVVVLMKTPRWQPLAGDHFFQVLTDAGIHPVAAVCQHVSAYAFGRRVFRMSPTNRREHARKLVSQMTAMLSPQPEAISPPGAAGMHGLPLRRINVRKHNSEECVNAVRALHPDVVLLRGTDIIMAPLLGTAEIFLNVHYGPLPEIRGMNAVQWALLLGLPPTLSLHRVSDRVDGGDILLQRRLPVRETDSLESLAALADRMAPEVFRDGLLALARPGVAWTTNTLSRGRQYFRMHPFLRDLAEARLRARGGAG